MDFDIKELPKRAKKEGEFDNRGFLIEFLTRKELREENKEFAHVYLATIAPNTIRGNHYHKETEEFFVIMSGKAKIILEDIKTKERKEILLDASENHIKRIRYGPNIAHAIKNISKETLFLTAYITRPYDHNDQQEYFLLKN